MEIKYIAFDSLGIKSMCTQVKTRDCTITIDPGIAEETNSFPLSLTERLWLAAKYKRKIKKSCKDSDILIITHYHYDHYIPEDSIYKDKILLIKDPEHNINNSQKARASYLLELVKGKTKEIRIADGKEFMFGKTKISFSKALWHGPKGTKLGKVIMAAIEDGNIIGKNKKKKLLFTSDIDGPYLEECANQIIKINPDILIMDGFPSYLLGFIASLKNLKKVIENTIKIIENTNCDLYIIDHHLLRDYRYREIYYEVYKKAKEKKKKVVTAAELLGKKPAVIKSYNKNGPTRWKKWEAYSFEKLDKMIKHAKKVAKEKK